MKITTSIIKRAYLYVKSYAYHENLNLFFKQRVAHFEVHDLDSALVELSDLLNGANPETSSIFQGWIFDIDHHILPKNINKTKIETENEAGLFLTNIKSADKYTTASINYLISAPIQIHIIETLWALIVGPVLEKKLTKNCYGNRLNDQSFFLNLFDNPEAKTGTEIFKRYIDQYNLWRNLAIETASNASKQQEDVAILSLDLQAYFYQINTDFSEIQSEIDEHFDDTDIKSLASLLNDLLRMIFERYRENINSKLTVSHPHCISNQGLPIGFVSSSILANWHLREFDHEIIKNIRPIYYGRYVDDILLVFKQPEIDENSPINSFIKKYLPELLVEDKDDFKLISNSNSFPLQKEKLILHYFEKDHSVAGLEVFKKELEERSSAFKLLPTNHINSDLDKFAYDLLYDGSPNKLRSIVGLAENETELSRFLSSHITAHRLSKINKKDTVLPQLKLFFKGTSALQFFRLWEKVYQYALVIQDKSFVIEFHTFINSEIDKLKFKRPPPTNSTSKHITRLSPKLKADLKLYNDLALSICAGLLDITAYQKILFDDVLHLEIDSISQLIKTTKLQRFVIENKLDNYAIDFRHSNLIRHHLVAWPLANYTSYCGDLTEEDSFRLFKDTELTQEKIDLSPRFIHFDEWQLFLINASLQDQSALDDWLKKSIDRYKDKNHWDNFPIDPRKIKNNGLLISEITIGEHQQLEKIKIGVANIKLPESDIEAAIRKDKKPNLSFERQSYLFDILNNALKDKVDILVLPEVAIPVSWLPFMIAYSRRNQIGLIFGLEHWVVGDIAYNLIIEALPFKTAGKYKSCVMMARIKNHYAPAEIEMLEAIRLKPASILLEKPRYHKVKWRGISFTTYNCFELSDVTHRAIFKSQIDLLIACVWNKDTNYYEHILESVVRDIHCYVVQSNTSQYGGSCVLRPSKTEYKTMLYVKGGDNASILTAELDIKALREFQFKSKKSEKDQFKHLPPGYDHEAVLKR